MATKTGIQWADSTWSPWRGWVVVGGESGHEARTCDVEWIRGVINQCRLARTPVFLKQVGARLGVATTQERKEWRALRDPKGGDPSEWPESFRVRQFPSGVSA